MARRNKTRKRSESADTVNINNSMDDVSMPGPGQSTGRAHKKKKTSEVKALVEPSSIPTTGGDVGGIVGGGGLHQSSDQSSDVISDAIGTVPDGNERTDVIAGLVNRIAEQQAAISRLTHQVDFLLSYLGISTAERVCTGSVVTQSATMALATGANPPADGDGGLLSTSQAQQLVEDSEGSTDVLRPPSFANITVRRPTPLSAAMKQAVVSAVYQDFEDRDRRNHNIVINGIPQNENNDAVTVKRLLEDEYGRTYEVVRCRRLGRPVPGRTQPVLVTLTTAAEAQYLVSNAKLLRQSSDSHIRATVFINPDVTRAEAFAAFQERCERRRRAATRPTRVQQQTVVEHRTSQRPQQPAAPQISMVATQSSLPPIMQRQPSPPSHIATLPSVFSSVDVNRSVATGDHLPRSLSFCATNATSTVSTSLRPAAAAFIPSAAVTDAASVNVINTTAAQ